MGGMVEAIERGFPQKEIAESSYRFQQAFERKEKVIVGVNDYIQEDEQPIDILYIDETAGDTQLASGRRRHQNAFARGGRLRPSWSSQAPQLPLPDASVTTVTPGLARRPRLWRPPIHPLLCCDEALSDTGGGVKSVSGQS